jgi:chromosome segregation ATPase
MPDLNSLSAVIREFGVPGSALIAAVICLVLATRAGAAKSSAESEAIVTNAKMANQSQAQAFKQGDLLVAATERLVVLERRVGQLELEGVRKDQLIENLQNELRQMKSTIGDLERQLVVERKKNQSLTEENAARQKQVEALTQQIEMLTQRLERMDTTQLNELAQAVEQLDTPAETTQVHIQGIIEVAKETS